MKGSHVGRGNESSIICPLGRCHCSGSHPSWVMSGPSPTTLCCLTKLLVLLPGLQAAAQQCPAFKGGRPARSSAEVDVKTAGKCPDSLRCDAALSALNTTALRWLSMKRLPPTCCRKWRRCSIKQLLHLFFCFLLFQQPSSWRSLVLEIFHSDNRGSESSDTQAVHLNKPLL